MITIDDVEKKLQIKLAGAVTTNELEWNVSYIGEPAYGDADGVTAGATITDMLPGADAIPGTSIYGTRSVANISVFNSDTVDAEIEILYYNGTTTRTIVNPLLPPKYTLHYENDRGWYVTDESGATVETIVSVTAIEIGDVVIGGTPTAFLYVDGDGNLANSVMKQDVVNSLITIPDGYGMSNEDPTKSRWDFGASGNEFNFYTDGGDGNEAFLIIHPSYINFGHQTASITFAPSYTTISDNTSIDLNTPITTAQNIGIINGKYIGSVNPVLARFTFGAAGNEFKFTTDGGVGNEATFNVTTTSSTTTLKSNVASVTFSAGLTNPIIFSIDRATSTIDIGVAAGYAKTINIGGALDTINSGGTLLLAADATAPLGAVTYQQLQAWQTGLWDDRGNYTPIGGNYPSAGGSGTAGAINKGDTYTIAGLGSGVTAVMGTKVVNDGDVARALVNTPGNTDANWAIQEGNLGYTPITNVLNNTYILVGNASNVATPVTMSGDATIANTGAVTVASIGGKSVTLGGSFTMSGAFTFTGTITGNTSVTFPTSGTLAVIENPLSQFAATTSAQLAGVISDETGSGALVFGTSPVIRIPTIGDTADPTKAITYSLSGATTAKTVTHTYTHTDDRTVTWQDRSITVAADSQFTMICRSTTISPLNGETHYVGFFNSSTNATRFIFSVPKTGIIFRIDLYIYNGGTLGSNESVTVSFRLNNTTDTQISNVVKTDQLATFYSNKALSISVTEDDTFNIKWLFPTYGTKPTSLTCNAVIYMK